MRTKLLLVVLVATLSGCWLFEVPDLTHSAEVDAANALTTAP